MSEIKKDTEQNQQSENRGSRFRGNQSGGRGEYRGRGRFAPRYRESIDFQTIEINYKKPDVLRNFVTEQGKILPRRITRVSAKIQRKIVREIKKARILALLPFENK